MTANVARNEPAADAIERAYAREGAAGDNPVWIQRVPEATALAHARDAARRQRCGKALPLAGLPFAVKDNIDVAGLPTTAACPSYAYQPKRSATAVQKLLDAGAVCVGKTNLDQFATGLAGVRSPYGACRNAFHPDYISGGSSSGSALAVALGMAEFALGTDTAGSGRVPAAFNNLVGLKPTRGLVSTAGVVPACRSLDCVSVFARTANRALQVLDAMRGFDPEDPYSRHPEARPLGEGGAPALRVAVPSALEFYGDAGYERLFARALDRLGGRRVPVDFAPFLAAQKLLYDGPWVAERTAQLDEFIRSHGEHMHPVTRELIAGGARYSAVDTFRAQHRLAALRRETEPVWAAADVLVVPGAPTIYRRAEVEADPIALNARLGLYTNFVNLLDLAAITVPAGFREDGLPFGITIIGPAFTDRALAAVAARFLGEPEIAVQAAEVRIAVVGAHLSGMKLNGQLTERGATRVREARTSADYRLYDLADGRPGLVRTPGAGAPIAIEVWRMAPAAFGGFVAQIPPPLGIGTLELEDGEQVKGFLCESYAAAGKRDITAFGGWRRYQDSKEPKDST
jgi:allophanate hydrolase